jgi:hypothetical protein
MNTVSTSSAVIGAAVVNADIRAHVYISLRRRCRRRPGQYILPASSPASVAPSPEPFYPLGTVGTCLGPTRFKGPMKRAKFNILFQFIISQLLNAVNG